jgi:uncharacterized membrane protein YphA (DoxX/SURF4 family)
VNTTAWVLQAVLAVVFLLHGLLYAVPGWDRRMRPEGAPRPIPISFQRFIGVAEIAAAAGLILPGLFKFLTWLTPLAALGLVIVMAGAVVFHLRRSETPMAVGTLVLGLLAAFVVYLRWLSVPLS